jgi:hypothetical protein
MDIELFYPVSRDPSAFAGARAVCAACPVFADCLESAQEQEAGKHYRSRYGMRGQMSPYERYLAANPAIARSRVIAKRKHAEKMAYQRSRARALERARENTAGDELRAAVV